jgi:hypothetical protein
MPLPDYGHDYWRFFAQQHENDARRHRAIGTEAVLWSTAWLSVAEMVSVSILN